MSGVLPGAVPSPNIWDHPELYELENAAVDPDGLIDAAIAEVRPWAGADVLDVGCGTGYHIPMYAATARHVVGIEPHAGLAAAARTRCGRLGNVTVQTGTAQALPIPSASVDLAQARWAYFFGPGCEPGLRELARVVRRGGAAVIVDHDATASPFGRWFRRWLPAYHPAAVERFWARQGFSRRALTIRWRFTSVAERDAVLAIEFPAPLVADILAELGSDLEFEHAVNLWHRHSR